MQRHRNQKSINLYVGTPTCKDCPDRFVGCHGVCEKYLRFNEERKFARAKVKKAQCDWYFGDVRTKKEKIYAKYQRMKERG